MHTFGMSPLMRRFGEECLDATLAPHLWAQHMLTSGVDAAIKMPALAAQSAMLVPHVAMNVMCTTQRELRAWGQRSTGRAGVQTVFDPTAR